MRRADNIECKLNFEVPDGYFETLADNVMQRIDFDDRQQKKRRTKIVRSIMAIASAATLVGIAVLGLKDHPNAIIENEQQMFSTYYLSSISAQYNDINVIDYIDQNNNPEYEDTEYDTDMLAMYASPINFMY